MFCVMEQHILEEPAIDRPEYLRLPAPGARCRLTGLSRSTMASFGDVQLHLEWTTPTGADASRVGQFRGNSGVIFMGRYEVQVLSGYNNPTYPDGAAGAIYGLYPPMVNPCLPEIGSASC